MLRERRIRRKCARIFLSAALLAFMTTASGCYYMHLAVGQAKLIFGAVPVEEAVREGSLSTTEAEKLQLVARVKAFGEQSLGLKSTGSYETVYLKSRQNPLHTISASPKDRLSRVTWWFPVVGDMPYIGYFDVESARKKRAKLESQDLDVVISKASAYSTLGWFNDPVTLNLLDEGPVELAATILHEMTHTTLYAKGQGEFNEGVAMLVGLVGAARFFKETYGPSHPLTLEGSAAVEDERTFSSFLDGLMRELEALYGSPVPYEEKLSAREAIFSKAKERFKESEKSMWTGRYARFGSSDLNNAFLMILGLYHRHFALFETFLRSQEESIPKTLAALKRMASAKGDLLENMRTSLTSDPPRPAGPLVSAFKKGVDF